MGILTKQSKSEIEPDKRPESWAARLSDAMIFAGVLLLPALAIAAIAVAAPIILAASVVAGLIFKNAPTKSWRRARA